MDDEMRRTLFRLTAVKLEVAGQALGLGRNSIYKAAKDGSIPVIRIGGSVRVPTAWLRRTLHLEQGAA